jgi:phosphopentomutase
VIVMDSVGIGELPDAAAYGDQGSDTVGNIAKRIPLAVPTLRRLGFDRVANIGPLPHLVSDACLTRVRQVPDTGGTPMGAYGRMAEASAGKDSVTGHWEMMGIVLDRAFPTFPDGFPADIVGEFARRLSRSSAPSTCAPAR